MHIHCVTITGADDGVEPMKMLELSERFPFVEWGILFSPDRFETPRYPSRRWLDGLADVAKDGALALSAHLCGRFSRNALGANWDWQRAVGDIAWLFGRVQINCGHNPEPSIGPMLREWPTTQRVIIQCSTKNEHWVEGAAEDGGRFDVLFDSSGGRGEMPGRWPHAFERVLCGYAGGLGPENVVESLPCFDEAANGRSFWIDMESRVRTHDGRHLDLSKVSAVLKSVKPFITERAA